MPVCSGEGQLDEVIVQVMRKLRALLVLLPSGGADGGGAPGPGLCGDEKISFPAAAADWIWRQWPSAEPVASVVAVSLLSPRRDDPWRALLAGQELALQNCELVGGRLFDKPPRQELACPVLASHVWFLLVGATRR